MISMIAGIIPLCLYYLLKGGARTIDFLCYINAPLYIIYNTHIPVDILESIIITLLTSKLSSQEELVAWLRYSEQDVVTGFFPSPPEDLL